MDIAALSTLTSQLSLQSAVSTQVMSMSLDSFEQISASQVKMMEQSVTPELGQNIDVYV